VPTFWRARPPHVAVVLGAPGTVAFQRIYWKGTSVVSDGEGAGPVVYIDRSDIHEGRWDELKADIRALVAFVEPINRRWWRMGSTWMRTPTG
jgi:hypothetical protein